MRGSDDGEQHGRPNQSPKNGDGPGPGPGPGPRSGPYPKQDGDNSRLNRNARLVTEAQAVCGAGGVVRILSDDHNLDLFLGVCFCFDWVIPGTHIRILDNTPAQRIRIRTRTKNLKSKIASCYFVRRVAMCHARSCVTIGRDRNHSQVGREGERGEGGRFYSFHLAERHSGPVVHFFHCGVLGRISDQSP